jgi:hypothetical protein
LSREPRAINQWKEFLFREGFPDGEDDSLTREGFLDKFQQVLFELRNNIYIFRDVSFKELK